MKEIVQPGTRRVNGISWRSFGSSGLLSKATHHVLSVFSLSPASLIHSSSGQSSFTSDSMFPFATSELLSYQYQGGPARSRTHDRTAVGALWASVRPGCGRSAVQPLRRRQFLRAEGSRRDG